MKIQNLRRLTIEDFPDLPEQFQEVFEAINDIFEPLVDSLQKRLNAVDNFEAEDAYIQFTSGTETEVTLQKLKTKPRFVRVSPDLHDSATVKWQLVRPGVVALTITLATAPTDEQKAWVRFEP